MINAKLIMIISSLILPQAFAGSLEAAYQAGKEIAQTNLNKVLEEIKGYNPSDKFKNYIENPAETKYYQGVGSYNPNLEKIGAEEGLKNEAIQAARDSRINQPRIKINPNEPYIVSNCFPHDKFLVNKYITNIKNIYGINITHTLFPLIILLKNIVFNGLYSTNIIATRFEVPLLIKSIWYITIAFIRRQIV